MSSEVLLSNIIPFAGSGLIGYAMGFALKKMLKWILIIVGFLSGMFFVGVQLLQKYGYVSTVNWETTLKGMVFKRLFPNPKKVGNGIIRLFPEPWQPLHSSHL
jgi:uncharacterized membrane protein (Fun14 family)